MFTVSPRSRDRIRDAVERVEQELSASVSTAAAAPDTIEVHLVKITSTTKIAGRYPGTLYHYDADADTLTPDTIGDIWIKAFNSVALETGVFYPARVAGARSADGKLIYYVLLAGSDAEQVANIIQFICKDGALYKLSISESGQAQVLSIQPACCGGSGSGSGIGGDCGAAGYATMTLSIDAWVGNTNVTNTCLALPVQFEPDFCLTYLGKVACGLPGQCDKWQGTNAAGIVTLMQYEGAWWIAITWFSGFETFFGFSIPGIVTPGVCNPPATFTFVAEGYDGVSFVATLTAQACPGSGSGSGSGSGGGCVETTGDCAGSCIPVTMMGTGTGGTGIFAGISSMSFQNGDGDELWTAEIPNQCPASPVTTAMTFVVNVNTNVMTVYANGSSIWSGTAGITLCSPFASSTFISVDVDCEGDPSSLSSITVAIEE
jgi:hypothetical protein